jgi:hypothetical protein
MNYSGNLIDFLIFSENKINKSVVRGHPTFPTTLMIIKESSAMIFSTTNPPTGYYHYLYLRIDGTPYYSGKGKGGRAWSSSDHVIKPPRDHSRIIITHWGLTELWALAMERWYIRWYGRKDKNTGILRNMTDGGDGATGRIASVAERRQKSISQIGKKVPWMCKPVNVEGITYPSRIDAVKTLGWTMNQLEQYIDGGVDKLSSMPKRVSGPDGTIYKNKKTAAAAVGVSSVTILSWCRKNKDGWKEIPRITNFGHPIDKGT